MSEDDIKKILQEGIDKTISNIETFPEDIRNQIKSEYDRMIKEREEWLKNHTTNE